MKKTAWITSLRPALLMVLSGMIAAKASAQQTANAAASLMFDQVTVVDVEQGTLIPNQRVVITGNRIQAMGNAGTVALPKGAQVVDARGRYLIPGLWDMHTHSRYLTDVFYPLFLAYGVTGIRDAWSEIPLDTLRQWRREILAGARVGPPRQLLVGRALSDEDSATAQQAVDSLKAAGADMIKTYPFTFALAAAARRAGMLFGGHVNADTPAMEAADSGINLIDHPNTSGGLDELCLADDATVEQCRPLAEQFRRHNTWWVPTFTRAIEAQYTGPGIGARSQAIYGRWAERISQFWSDSLAPSRLADHTEVHAGGVALSQTPSATTLTDSGGVLRRIQRVGLPILAGTDTGAPVVSKMVPGLMLHVELEMYVAEGLTPLNALQSATLNPAKLIHGTDSLGTVAPGKLADLVLLDANPLDDITNTTTIRAVVANGRYFDRTALDQMLAKVQAKGSQP